MMNWMLSSSLLIVLVILLRLLLRGRISHRLQYALWGIVLLRLLLPGSLGQTAISMLNTANASETVQTVTILEPYDRIWHSGDGAVEGYPSNALMPDAPVVIAEDVTEADFARMQTILTAREGFTALWLAGVVLMLAIFALSNRRFRKGLTALDWHTYETCPLPVFVTDTVEGPCLFGLTAPAIFLPPEVWADPVVCRHAVAHEETHYRHKDHIWSALRCLALALHWYNPLVWLAARLAYQDSELACDEGTLARLGPEERIQYGRTLLDLTCGKRLPLCAATTMLNNKSELRERISAIAREAKPRKLAAVAAIAVVCLLAVSAFTGALYDSAPPETGSGPFSGTVTPEDIHGVTHIELSYTQGDYLACYAYGIVSDDDAMVQLLQNSVRLDYVPNCSFGLTVEVTLDTEQKYSFLLATDGCSIWKSEDSYYHYDGDNAFLIRLVSGSLLDDAIDRGCDMEDIGPMLQFLDWRHFCPLPRYNREKYAQATVLLTALDDWCTAPDIDSDTRTDRMTQAVSGIRNTEGAVKEDMARLLASWLTGYPEEFARAYVANGDTATRTAGMELLQLGTGMTEAEVVEAINNPYYAAYLERLDAAEIERFRTAPALERFDITYAGSKIDEFTAAIGEVTLLTLNCGNTDADLSDAVWTVQELGVCHIEAQGSSALVTITDVGSTDIVVSWNGYQAHVLVRGIQAWSAA